jgi:hypothetical protein
MVGVDGDPARADEPHPLDPAVLPRRQVALLLDDEAAFRVRDRQPVAQLLAIGDDVRVDALERPDLVGVIEPVAVAAIAYLTVRWPNIPAARCPGTSQKKV